MFGKPKTKPETSIKNLDFGDAQDAVEKLGCKIVGDLAQFKEYQLVDAIEGLTAVEEVDHRERRVVTVQLPPNGTVQIGNLHDSEATYDESGLYMTGTNEKDTGILPRRVRELFRRAQQLQDDA